MSPFKTVDFQKLARKWDEKLKRSGFKDIEQPLYNRHDDSSWPERTLTVFDSLPSTWRDGQESNREEFFRLAGQFLHAHTFSGRNGRFHRRVWELHCQGLDGVEISKQVTYVPWKDPKRDYRRRHPHRSVVVRSIQKTTRRMLAWVKEQRGRDE